MAPARNICHKEAPANSARVCSVVSLDERDSRAPLRRQLSVDEERGCAGHWLPRQGGTDPDEGNTGTGQCPTGQGPTGPGAARGLRLYRAHLLRCLAAQGLRAPACAQMPVRADTGWWGWWWDTRALQLASRRFALSPQRAALRVRANSVQLAALDFPTFQHILQTLFQEGGASIERVLALFYFLSDLSCAALRSGLRAHFCRVTGWAARHVAECATPWVRRHGGWGRVVRGSAGQAAADVTALTALAAFCALASFCVYRMMRPQAIANC